MEWMLACSTSVRTCNTFFFFFKQCVKSNDHCLVIEIRSKAKPWLFWLPKSGPLLVIRKSQKANRKNKNEGKHIALLRKSYILKAPPTLVQCSLLKNYLRKLVAHIWISLVDATQTAIRSSIDTKCIFIIQVYSNGCKIHVNGCAVDGMAVVEVRLMS